MLCNSFYSLPIYTWYIQPNYETAWLSVINMHGPDRNKEVSAMVLVLSPKYTKDPLAIEQLQCPFFNCFSFFSQQDLKDGVMHVATKDYLWTNHEVRLEVHALPHPLDPNRKGVRGNQKVGTTATLWLLGLCTILINKTIIYFYSESVWK